MTPTPSTCEQCGTTMQARPGQHYCSHACRQRAYLRRQSDKSWSPDVLALLASQVAQ